MEFRCVLFRSEWRPVRGVRADLPYRCSSRGILPRQMILIHALTYLQIPRFFVINRRDDRGGRRRHAAPAGRAILLFDMISAKAWSADVACDGYGAGRSEEHTSELQSLMRISYAVFCV